MRDATLTLRELPSARPRRFSFRRARSGWAAVMLVTGIGGLLAAHAEALLPWALLSAASFLTRGVVVLTHQGLLAPLMTGVVCILAGHLLGRSDPH